MAWASAQFVIFIHIYIGVSLSHPALCFRFLMFFSLQLMTGNKVWATEDLDLSVPHQCNRDPRESLKSQGKATPLIPSRAGFGGVGAAPLAKQMEWRCLWREREQPAEVG